MNIGLNYASGGDSRKAEEKLEMARKIRESNEKNSLELSDIFNNNVPKILKEIQTYISLLIFIFFATMCFIHNINISYADHSTL